MKKLIIILTLIFITLAGFSQEKLNNSKNENSIKYGVCFDDAISNKDFCGFEFVGNNLIQIIEPALVLHYKRFSASLGPRFVFQQKYSYKRERPNIGAGIGLSGKYYFTESPNKTLKLFALTELSYLKLKYNSFLSGYDDTWHANHYIFEIGIGLKGSIIKDFYFQTALTLGISRFVNIGDNVNYSNPIIVEYGKYKHLKTGYLHFGFGYDF